MGADEIGLFVIPPIASREEVVIATLRSRGMEVTETSSGRSYRIEHAGKKVFLPKGLPGNGYTQDQLDFIEWYCNICGVDLFPLDPNLI